MTARIGGLLALAIATSALLPAESHAREGALVVAQRTTRLGSGPSADQRQQDQYLQVAQRLRSQCQSGASTLWHNNGYQAWRDRKSSIMHMLYSSASYPTLPPVPTAWPEPMRGRIETAVTRANEVVKESSTTFKELADYINAKDYEDDKFKKGDGLNAKLVEGGRTCHGLFTELTALYTEAAERMIEERRSSAAKPEVVETMIADWRKARVLSAELGRFEKADPGRLDELVKEISALADDRKANFAPLKENPDVRVRNFYASLNDKVAVKMRRNLRDAKTPAAFASMARDTPRSSFWDVKGDIDVGMPDEILRAIQQMK